MLACGKSKCMIRAMKIQELNIMDSESSTYSISFLITVYKNIQKGFHYHPRKIAIRAIREKHTYLIQFLRTGQVKNNFGCTVIQIQHIHYLFTSCCVIIRSDRKKTANHLQAICMIIWLLLEACFWKNMYNVPLSLN